jgi:hypothetical protein
MKLGHGYFKSYLHRLPDYDNKKCHGTAIKLKLRAFVDSLSILQERTI